MLLRLVVGKLCQSSSPLSGFACLSDGAEKYGKAIKYDSKPSFPPPPFLLWHKALFPAISPTFLPREKGRGKKREKIPAGKVTMCCRLLGKEGEGGRLSRPPSLFLGFPPPPPLFLFREILNRARAKLVGKRRKKFAFLISGKLGDSFRANYRQASFS